MTRLAAAGGGYGAALRVREVRLLWLAQLASVLGDAALFQGLNVWVYERTGSAAAVAGLQAYRLVPFVLGTAVAGAVADRLDRRRLLVAADLGRAGLVGAMALIPQLEAVYVLWALTALLAALFRPALLAAVPAVAGPHVVPALALLRLTITVGQVAGPGLAVGLLGRAGLGGVVLFDAATFLVSAALLARLGPMGPGGGPARGMPTGVLRGFLGDVLEGARAVVRHPLPRLVIGAGMLAALPGAFVQAGTVAYVRAGLGLGPEAYALLMSAYAAGAAAAFAVLGQRWQRLDGPRVYLGGLVALPTLLVLAAARPPLPGLVVLWSLMGVAAAAERLSAQRYLAAGTPDRLRGRVFGAEISLGHAGWLVAYGLTGWWLERLGPERGTALAGTVALLLTAGWLAAQRAPAVLRAVEAR